MSSDSSPTDAPRPSPRRRRGQAGPGPAPVANERDEVAAAPAKAPRRRGKRGGALPVEDAQIVEEQRLEVEAQLPADHHPTAGALSADAADRARLAEENGLLAAALERLRGAHEKTTAELEHLRGAHEKTTAELEQLRRAHQTLGARAAVQEAAAHALRTEVERLTTTLAARVTEAGGDETAHRATVSALFDQELVPALADLNLRVRALERYATAVLPPRSDQVTGVSRAAWRQLERIERLIETVRSAPRAVS